MKSKATTVSGGLGKRRVGRFPVSGQQCRQDIIPVYIDGLHAAGGLPGDDHAGDDNQHLDHCSVLTGSIQTWSSSHNGADLHGSPWQTFCDLCRNVGGK